MATPARRAGKGGKRFPNIGPARERYWREGHLERNKVRNLMKHNGMKHQEAREYWRKARQGRRR